MSNHLISVIVPVYNVEPYLRQCLDSIVNQTYPNIEILIVDDGSPDHCGEICDEYAEKDSRITVIHQENAGLSAARNAALDIARGEYIMFVDSDDWVEPTFCEKALEMVIEHQVEIACFGYKKNAPNKVQIVRTKNPRKIVKAEAMKHLIYNNEPSLYTQVWNKIFNKKLFLNLRFPIGMIYEDNDIIYKLIHRVSFLYLSDEVLYNYSKYRNDSLDSCISRNRAKNIIDLFTIRYKRLGFLKQFYPELVERQTMELVTIIIYKKGYLNGKTINEKQTNQMMYDFLMDNKFYILSKTKNKHIRFCLHGKKALSIFCKIVTFRNQIASVLARYK